MLRVLIVCGLLLISNACYAAISWQTLQPGIEYAFFTPKDVPIWSRIQAFRIDPKFVDLQLALAADHHKQNANVKELAEAHDALLAINGGFFSPSFSPIGLRISHGIQKHPMKNISWWGIFYMENHHPYITSPHQLKLSHAIDLAIQSGPRLLIDKTIPILKPGIAERTAIGITREKKMIIAVTQHYPLTTTAFALILRDEFDCQDALNFDGGRSTQLFARIGAFSLQLDGFSNIADALLVLPKAR